MGSARSKPQAFHRIMGKATGIAIDNSILEPGYAGLLTPAEAKLITERLLRSHPLRRRWGVDKQKSYAATMIAAKAFPENPRAAREHLRRASEKGRPKSAPKRQGKPQGQPAASPKRQRRPQAASSPAMVKPTSVASKPAPKAKARAGARLGAAAVTGKGFPVKPPKLAAAGRAKQAPAAHRVKARINSVAPRKAAFVSRQATSVMTAVSANGVTPRKAIPSPRQATAPKTTVSANGATARKAVPSPRQASAAKTTVSTNGITGRKAASSPRQATAPKTARGGRQPSSPPAGPIQAQLKLDAGKPMAQRTPRQRSVDGSLPKRQPVSPPPATGVASGKKRKVGETPARPAQGMVPAASRPEAPARKAPSGEPVAPPPQTRARNARGRSDQLALPF